MANSLKNKNVLVTGGTGFAGGHLVEALLQEGANVVSTIQTSNPASYFYTSGLDKKTKLVTTDVNDADGMLDVVSRFDTEYIFHLAAQPLVEVAYYNPEKTLKTNINGTINILEAARLYPKVKGVIVASSDKAYGKLTEGKYLETDALKGDHPYEVSKSAADLICNSYFKTYNVPVVTTRFGNIYGEGDLNYSRIIPGALRAVVLNESLDIRSDGKHVRDYLYVKDVAKGYIAIAEKIDEVKGEAFNFGSDDSLSVLQVLEAIEKALNVKVPYSIKNTAKNEIPYQSLNFEKVQKLIGWKPQKSLLENLPAIFNWYKESLTR